MAFLLFGYDGCCLFIYEFKKDKNAPKFETIPNKFYFGIMGIGIGYAVAVTTSIVVLTILYSTSLITPDNIDSYLLVDKVIKDVPQHISNVILGNINLR